MAENSRMSKLSEKEDECIFSWKLFTGWDFMIGNAETAHNRIASVILGFKEALLEEAEKKKDLRNWRVISQRVFVNICVIFLLATSAYGVVTVVSRSDTNRKPDSWWRENETTIVVTLISITFPIFFELLGILEHYHPRKQLRLQLARIMLLNLLNLYSLIFALFNKIDDMSKELDLLKPNLTMNASIITNETLNINESMALKLSDDCFEKEVPCGPCSIELVKPINVPKSVQIQIKSTAPFYIHNACASASKANTDEKLSRHKRVILEKRYMSSKNDIPDSALADIELANEEKKKLREIIKQQPINFTNFNDTTDLDSDDYSFDVINTDSKPDMIHTMVYSSYEYLSTTTNISTDINTTQDTRNIENTSTTVTDYTDFSVNDNISTTIDPEVNTILIYNHSTSYTPLETAYTDLTLDYVTENDVNISTTTIAESPVISDITTNTIATITDSVIINTFTSYTSTSNSQSNITSEGLGSTTISDWHTLVSDYDSITTELTTARNTNSKPKLPVIIKSNICPITSLNFTVNCNGFNITHVIFISSGYVEKLCYKRTCGLAKDVTKKKNNTQVIVDFVYENEQNKKIYNLTIPTRKKLLKLCWETMFGQELVKLTMMDLVFVFLGTLFMDFFRALLVRYLNRCWCWDLEKKFPEYGDFKIAENILHLINNQGMVWMGMFFSPGLVVLNVGKLMIMMYLRSWAVMTCNVPHEVVFRVSKSNNFYLALLLTMLFLCVLPVGYTIVWVKPSWHCGPFSEYEKIYYIITRYYIRKILPDSLNFILDYIASPAIVLPLLALLILIIYYLTSLTNSLREANNDLKIQLRRERTEERRKMFQLADTRRRGCSSSIENTPFARWKKALPSLSMSKSIDSDERKTLTEETKEPVRKTKKRGGIFAKIVGMALDKTTEVPTASNDIIDDETDTDFHETLPKEILKIKEITVVKSEQKPKNIVEFKTDDDKKSKIDDKSLKVKHEKVDDRTDKKAIIEKQMQETQKEVKSKVIVDLPKEKGKGRKINKTQTSESSTQSKQSDSVGSVIPVITISTTESDEEVLSKKSKKHKNEKEVICEERPRKLTESKSLRRQSSVESINEHKATAQENKQEGHKYQYSL